MACTPGIVLSRYYFQFQARKFILNDDCNLKYIVTHVLCTLFPFKPYWLRGEYFPYLTYHIVGVSHILELDPMEHFNPTTWW
jgi:hypothetical protein